MSQGGGGRLENSSRGNAGMREFSGNVLEKHGMREFSRNSCEKRQFQEIYLLKQVKCPRPKMGTLFPHRKMYKNCVSDGKNVPVSTWEFPLF
jgi:hypothetical protein